jgi:hypothetical protein
MRYVSFVVAVLVLLLAAAPAHCSSGRSEQFHQWALKRGEGFDTEWNEKLIKKQRTDLDRRWNSIAISKESRSHTGPATSQRYNRAGTSRTYFSRSKPVGTDWPISGSEFIHKGHYDFLPSSTRMRSGPTRGIISLKNPARASRGFTRDGRRGLRASTKMRNIFGPQRGISRPRIDSPGRWSHFKRHGRSFSRPRSRPDRPKRFR